MVGNFAEATVYFVRVTNHCHFDELFFHRHFDERSEEKSYYNNKDFSSR